MTSERGKSSSFRLFDFAGVGVAGLDEDLVIQDANLSFSTYYDLDPASLVGQALVDLKDQVRSTTFWEALEREEAFYCLMPGRNHLLLTICRPGLDFEHNGISRILVTRPYSLEREFIRMRSRLNRHLVYEVSSHLSSIAIASEIILQPELQEDPATKDRFLSTFQGDIKDLSQLFNELQEISEPIPFPGRVRETALDWRSLVFDLSSKMRGYANEKNISIELDLANSLPSVRGDYQWLTLALYGVLEHAVGSAQPLSEIVLSAHVEGDSLQTHIVVPALENREDDTWPPPMVFPLSGEEMRIGRMGMTDLSLSLGIIRLHEGDLTQETAGSRRELRIDLPL